VAVGEEVKRGLATAGDGDIFRPEIPAEGLAKECGNGLQEMRIPARRVVNGERSLEAAHFFHQLFQAPPPDGVHLRDAGGLATAEHFQVRSTASHGMAEIIHQSLDAAAASEVLAKF
jgi:hypothetical protein